MKQTIVTLIAMTCLMPMAFAQVTLVEDILPGTSGSLNSGSFAVYNGNLYFNAYTAATGAELYSYDGTTVSLVEDILPGTSGSMNETNFAVYNGILYFNAYTAATGAELFSYDGTSVSLVEDILPGTSGSMNSTDFAVYNGNLYFNAYTAATGAELFSYDGVNVSLVEDILPGTSGGMNSASFVVYNSELYFNAYTAATGAELFSYDGVTVSLVEDILPGTSGGMNSANFAVYNNELYFNAYTAATGAELFSYDGVTVGLVEDILPGTSGGMNEVSFAVYNGNLYFNAYTAATGSELFSYDGVTVGLVEDVLPGTSGGLYWGGNGMGGTFQSVVEFNGTLYFSAYRPATGTELYSFFTCNISPGTDTRTECNSYTWIDGTTYTSSNNSATFNIVGGAANGCDSLVTLDLTINTVSNLTTTISGPTIIASNGNATYEWLNCDNNFSVMPGETNQGFTPATNGNYAVELTENGCVDTSACVAITTVGIVENNFEHKLTVYPNPTSGNFSIDLGSIFENSEISITDISGKLVVSKTITQSQVLNLSINEPAGIYIVSIQAGDKKAVIRLIKE
jgi:ELWxxDGT repeat protein